MGFIDLTLVLKKNAYASIMMVVALSIAGMIYYIGIIKVPELLWNQERNIRMMIVQEKIDRYQMEFNHMAAYKRKGFVTDYQEQQYDVLPYLINNQKTVYYALESATYPEQLVSGPRGMQ